MSAGISRQRMIACALAVAVFAAAVWFAVRWRSQPPPPPQENRELLQKIEGGK
ncbi:MAG TPA: hypothetical protein VG733_03920 [Chthoniobacteraceae bacterium]|nr:hypothetical protein [Chthoniobacteraceae bacterium]